MPEPDKGRRLAFSRQIEVDRLPRRDGLVLPDGYETAVHVYAVPAGVARRAPVVYLHGIQSHPGWFVASAAALAGAGHPVYQPTRRGSGANREDRGHARSADQLLDDLAAACRFALDDSGAARFHLVGVSWGGKLAAAFLAAGAEGLDVASLTLVAPGIAPRVDVSVGVKLAVGLSLLCCPRRRFDIPLSEVELFTDNEAMRRYLRGDRHRLHRATGRFLYVSRCLDRLLRRAPRGAISGPTTLVLASRDRIIDNARTRAAVDRLADEETRVVDLPGAHTLEFEEDPTPLFDVLQDAARGS